MTNDCTILKNTFPVKQFIRTAGNDTMQGTAAGNTTLHTQAGPIFLPKVLFVPELKQNLISPDVLADSGVTMLIAKEMNRLQLPNGNSLVYLKPQEGNRTMIQAEHEIATEQCTVTDQLTHERFGHPGHHQQRAIARQYPNLKTNTQVMKDCNPCDLGKATKARLPTHSSEPKRQRPLEKLHIDIMTWNSSNSTYRFALVIVDDATSFAHVHPITSKAHALPALIDFVTLAERQIDQRVKLIRSDNDSVFTSNAALDWKAKKGILWETTTPSDSRQNGKVERMIRTLRERTIANINARAVPLSLWPEAIEYTALQLNLIPRDGNRIPIDDFWGSGNSSRISRFLQPFGCLAWAFIPESKRLGGKGGPKSLPAILIGLDRQHRGWKLYSPHASPTTFWSNSVRFHPLQTWSDRRKFANWKELLDQPEIYIPRGDDVQDLSYDHIDVITAKDQEAMRYYEKELTRQNEIEADLSLDAEDDVVRLDEDETTYAIDLTQDWRTLETTTGEKESKATNVTAEDIKNLSPTVTEALKGNDRTRWQLAIKAEIDGLREMGTWEEVDLPKGAPVVDSKLVLRIKTDAEGVPVKYKARLVARGFTQREGIDFEETFAPVAPFTAVRTVLSMAAKNRWHIHCTDFSQAYLNGRLEHAIFMKAPTGIDLPPGKVYKVIKGLYGLKQSGRVWNLELDKLLRRQGFVATDSTPSVYTKGVNENIVVVITYVDDLIITSPDATTVETMKTRLGQEFKLEDKGTIDSFCGIKVNYDKQRGILSLSQPAFTDALIEEYANDKSTAKTPMERTPIAGIPNPIVKHDYQRLVGKLLWLSNHTRPDITFAVGVLARHMTAPSTEALDAAVRVVRYLKNRPHSELVYEPCEHRFRARLCAFTDANWASDRNALQKSTSGSAIYLDGCLVTWKTQLQRAVSLSAVEAELIAASEAAREVLFVQHLLEEIGTNLKPLILTDSQGCVRVGKDPQQHYKLKHVATRYFFLREGVQSKSLDIDFVPSKNNLADIFTKPLSKTPFYHNARELDIRVTKKGSLVEGGS